MSFKQFRYILIGFLYLTMSMASAQAKMAIDVESSYFSRYIWNGLDLNHGDGALGLASAVDLKTFLKGLSISFWASFGLKKNNGAGDEEAFTLDEFDVFFGHDLKWSKWLSSYVELGCFYWASDFFSNHGKDKYDFEFALYHHIQLLKDTVLQINYKRGLDQGIRGDVVEMGLESTRYLFENIKILPNLRLTASSEYGVDFNVAQVVWTLPISIVFKSFAFTMQGQYFYIPHFKHLAQESRDIVAWATKFKYSF